MGVRVADCRADEWLLCVATPELKERLVRRTERKKKWLKVENILRKAAFQHTHGHTPRHRAALRLAFQSCRCFLIGQEQHTPLISVCPSLQHFRQRRGEILHRRGLNDSTVRPFRGRRRQALLVVLTCYIKQINNHQRSYCLLWSR